MLTLLNATDPDEDFPDPEAALTEPNGLLAIGGCLSPRRLISAYQQGIFPWFNPGDPIFWWSPDPRLILNPAEIHLSRSLRKVLRKREYKTSFDQAFEEVIYACAASRKGNPTTWITESMVEGYLALHSLGHAHSVEAWYDGHLAGGLYGVSIGRVFFGESMFYRRSNASKVAFAVLAQSLKRWNFSLIDCQIQNEHLLSLGAKEIPRKEFIDQIGRCCHKNPGPFTWKNGPRETSDL
jgi:leucyl/phenylalanyl-tRNA--protein transferase